MRVINLLPKNKQKELRYEAMFHSLLSFFTLSLLSFALVFAVQLGAKFILKAEAESYKAQIAELQGQVNKKENAETKSKIKQINDTVSDFKTLALSSPKYSQVLKAFAKLPPPGVSIDSVSIDFNKKSMMVTGQGETREAIIQMYNNIKADGANFYNVDYPLENVVLPSKQSFHYTFYIRDSLLK